MSKYRIHSMHGATVFSYDKLSDALDGLRKLERTNGGLYRVVEERSLREIASLDTYASTTRLNDEANEELRGKRRGKDA